MCEYVVICICQKYVYIWCEHFAVCLYFYDTGVFIAAGLIVNRLFNKFFSVTKVITVCM